MKAFSQQDKLYIYGKHTVREALTYMPSCVKKLYIHKDLLLVLDKQSLNHIKEYEIFKGNEVPRGVQKESVHQGIIAEIDQSQLLVPYKKFFDKYTIKEDSSMVVLAEIQDPHNVGAVIRSAAAFGIGGVCIPRHDQAQFSSTVAKVSAGMAFKVPLIDIGNVNSTHVMG